MDAFPRGTVTFLATDIQGSTEMWERYPDAMPRALERHEHLLREAVETRGGRVFKNVGDGLFIAFPACPPAVDAALVAQRSLFGEEWPTPVPVRVRMALHTGHAEERAGDYFGPPLNRVARILSAGYGGQILMSHALERLVADHLPSGAAVRDLGKRSLKDLTEPERIFQLVTPDLPSEFPPLNTLDVRPHNLPAQPTPIVGRTREVQEVRTLLLRSDVRLVSLLGSAGTGKTRLGLQVAAEVVDAFRDGVFHVDMAVVHRADQVPEAILKALAIQPEGDPVEALNTHLRSREILLVLDNFEQVLEAASLVAELLRTAGSLKMLVTSQAALRVRGEHEYPVLPLSIPGPRGPRSIEHLAGYEAVTMFTERAQAVVPSFRLEPANAQAVAEIVRQLDGLPLAIELAAARLKLFPPRVMVGRLAQRFDFLKGGRRDLPDRQRTLRSALEWSYNLLDEHERTIFRRLAVFDGGFTLEAAAKVCAGEDEDIDVEEVVVSLVDKSLLRPVTGDDGGPRFMRLRTIRDFSLDQLEESGEAEIWRRRHAEYFGDLAEQADRTRTAHLGVPEMMVRIEREYENLRAALAWALDRDETELALRLCRLPGLWLLGGQFGDVRQLVERLPSLPFEDDVQRADAINMAGRFAQLLGDNSPEVVSRFEEALALYRAAGHRAGTARALMNLGNVRAREGAYEEARQLFREALPLYRELNDAFGESGAMMNLGDSYLSEDDLDRAEEIFQQARSTARARGDRMAMSFALQFLGAVSHQRGDLDEAEARLREALVVFEEFGARPGIAWTWYYLAMVARDRGNLAEARSLFLDVVEGFRANDYRPGIAVALLGLANLEFREGRPMQAVQLLGTSRALRRGTRMTREAAEEMAEREVEEGGRESLGEAGYGRALEEGERFSLERALEIVGGEGAPFIDHPAPATGS